MIIGFASGVIPKVPANRLLLKQASLMGIFWGASTVLNSEKAQ